MDQEEEEELYNEVEAVVQKWIDDNGLSREVNYLLQVDLKKRLFDYLGSWK